MTQDDLLKSFLHMDVQLEALKTAFGRNLLQAEADHPATVTAHDAAAAIEKYLSGDISKEMLLDWVNTLWFTDLYAYDDAESDCIASVMSVLETLDEEGVSISPDDWQKMLLCLATNTEYME